MKSFGTLIAIIAITGLTGAHSARAQQDSTRMGVDSTTVVRTKSDTTRIVAPPRRLVDTTVNLWTLGKVEGSVRLNADLSERTLTVMGDNGVIKTFTIAVGSPS